jgi:hypothetical protein
MAKNKLAVVLHFPYLLDVAVTYLVYKVKTEALKENNFSDFWKFIKTCNRYIMVL